jgi:hypothetical protein
MRSHIKSSPDELLNLLNLLQPFHISALRAASCGLRLKHPLHARAWAGHPPTIGLSKSIWSVGLCGLSGAGAHHHTVKPIKPSFLNQR